MEKNKPINPNILAVAMCNEWLYLLFEKSYLGKPRIDINLVKNSEVRAALNQTRKGVSAYKKAMMRCNNITESDFLVLQEFASFKMDVLIQLAQAFIPLDENGCDLIISKIHQAVVELNEQNIHNNIP